MVSRVIEPTQSKPSISKQNVEFIKNIEGHYKQIKQYQSLLQEIKQTNAGISGILAPN
jgi:hypothetical protein